MLFLINASRHLIGRDSLVRLLRSSSCEVSREDVSDSAWTTLVKLEGNIPDFPFRNPSHQPSSTLTHTNTRTHTHTHTHDQKIYTDIYRSTRLSKEEAVVFSFEGQVALKVTSGRLTLSVSRRAFSGYSDPQSFAPQMYEREGQSSKGAT